MASAVLDREPVVAKEEERSRIEQMEDLYERQTADDTTFRLVGPGDEAIELPESIGHLLRQIVHVLAQGEAVSIVPVHKELTTQQAADLLNVSRQFLVQLLDRDEIPHHKVGTHRRIAFGDLMEYKHRRDQQRRKDLDNLTQMSQEMGLYR